MPIDFPDIESVIRRVAKPVDNIIRIVVSRLVEDKEAAQILLEHVATMPLGPRDTLASLLVSLVENGKTEFPGFLPGRGKYFRAPAPGESDDAYRAAAADWMRDVVGDAVEASEIRSGRGWDKQSPVEVLSELPGGLELAMLLRDTISRNRKT
jgi:hypothetical protein